LHHHKNETKKIKVAHIPVAGMRQLQLDQATPEGGVGTDGVACGGVPLHHHENETKKLR
jgi:hypothetical protein